jgi:hypothetical protein
MSGYLFSQPLLKKQNPEKLNKGSQMPIYRCDSILIKKINKNRGEGGYRLQGVRNLRAVMPGLLYRSGGNNLYHPLVSRHNYSPLSFQSLLNLWEMGFSEVVYLYKTRYDSLYNGELGEYLQQIGLQYSAIVPVKEKSTYSILKKIHSAALTNGSGYILIHCWNGWHMSGLISAYALMQFCGFDDEKAWQYWKMGTDGNYLGYEKLRDRIRSFRRYPDLILSDAQKKLYCPCENKK